LNEEGRKAQVIEMLNKEHPLSQNYNIPVYFTDVFEMEETKQDPTTQVLR